MRGKLIVFEGPDGVGKTTLVDKACKFLHDNNIAHRVFSFPGKKEGTLGAHIYHLHHNWNSMGIASIDPASLQTLHIAAHIDVIEKQIKPCLQSGCNVVLDRYWWSTLVYGLVSGVKRQSVEAMVNLELIHWEKHLPDALFLVRNVSPIREDVVDEKWHDLMQGYNCLANDETAKYPVHSIDTNSSINDSFQQIREVLQGLTRNLEGTI